MPTLGQILREAREQQGLTLVRIASETRISPRYLESIEADDLSSFPGRFFYRSFVLQYALALGVDSRLFKDELDRIAPPKEAPTEPVPISAGRISMGSFPAERSLKHDLNANIGFRFALLVFMVISCSAIYVLWRDTQKFSPSTPAPVQRPAMEAKEAGSPGVPAASSPTQKEGQAAAPKPAEPVTASTPPPTTPPIQEAPKPEEAKAEPPKPADPEPIATPPGEGVSMTVTAREDAWISLAGDGKTAYIGVLEADESKTVSAKEAARLRVGNAGGIRVKVNGKDVGPLGPRGQIRILTATPKTIEISEPPKPATKPPEGAPAARPSTSGA